MIITADNQHVENNIPTYKCPVKGEGTVILPPSKVNKYLGSYLRYKIIGRDILVPTGTILDIIEKEKINSKDWLLIKYNECYYYTPAEYIDTSNLINITNPIKKQSISKSVIDENALSKSDKNDTDENGEEEYTRIKLYKDDFIIYEAISDNVPLYNNPNGEYAVRILNKGDRCVVQSIWKNNKYNTTYFGTQTYDGLDCSYAEQKYFKEVERPIKKNGNIRYWSMIYLNTETRYGNGAPHGNLIRGDLTWVLYQDWVNGTHINADTETGPGIITYTYPAKCAAPLADSADMFNTKYFGTLRTNKKLYVYAMHRKANASGNDKKGCLSDISVASLNSSDLFSSIVKWNDDNLSSENKSIRDEIISQNPVYIDTLNSGTRVIVTNYVTINGESCYIGFKDVQDKNGAINYIAFKDMGVDIISYNPFPPADQPLDDITVPSIDDEPIIDMNKYNTPESYVEYNVTTMEDSESNKKKDGEPVYSVNLGIDKNQDFKVPGIMYNAPTTPPEYNGWSILTSAQNYNLSGELPFDTTHLTHINRFHLPTNNGGLSTKSFIFVTRPDLNLYKELDENGNVDTWAMNPDLKRLPGFIYMARLRGTKDAPGIGTKIMDSLEYYGTNDIDSPWLTVFTNQAAGYSPIDRNINVVEMGETFHGNKVIYAKPTFDHKIAGTVDIPFNERRDLTLYFTLRLWIEYIQAVSMGFCSPRYIHKKNNELDYAVSLFYIQTDETMENIIYWEKLTGLIPLTVPDSFFEWTEGTPAKDMKYTVRFAYSFRSVLDELHLVEINSLYRKWRTENVKGMEVIPPDNFWYVNNPKFNELLGRVGQFYDKITDTDEGLNQFVNSESMIRPYYYGGVVNPDTNTIQNISTISANNQNFNVNFLPNYNVHTQMHGIPYVKGPFIYHDDSAQKYLLKWV